MAPTGPHLDPQSTQRSRMIDTEAHDVQRDNWRRDVMMSSIVNVPSVLSSAADALTSITAPPYPLIAPTPSPQQVAVISMVTECLYFSLVGLY